MKFTPSFLTLENKNKIFDILTQMKINSLYLNLAKQDIIHDSGYNYKKRRSASPNARQKASQYKKARDMLRIPRYSYSSKSSKIDKLL